MALIEGFALFSLGIWLSFSATFSLMVLVPYLSKRMLHRLSEPLRIFLLSSLLPTLFSSIILICFRHTFHPYAFLANLIFLPLFESLVLLGVLFCSLWSFIHFFSDTLAYVICFPIVSVITGLMYFIEAVVTGITKLPFLEVSVSKKMFFSVMIPGLVCFAFLKKRSPFGPYKQVFSSLCIGLLCMMLVLALPKPLRITVLDVGQGDAILIQSPNQKTWLVDTGYGTLKPNRFDYASTVIIPALRYYGIQTLDGIIISHFDRDHIGSLASLLKKIDVKHILAAPNEDELLLLKKLILKHQKKTHITTPKHHQTRHVDKKTRLQFFKSQYKTNSKNNRSLVTHLKYKGFDMLLMGDAEKRQETQLLADLSKIKDIEVLKMGHHGSKTSSSQALLETVKPLIATISSGQNNRYGHPHAIVIKRLSHIKTHIFRTDQAGAIHIISNGFKIGVKRFLK